jgi:hypothetical protein
MIQEEDVEAGAVANDYYLGQIMIFIGKQPTPNEDGTSSKLTLPVKQCATTRTTVDVTKRIKEIFAFQGQYVTCSELCSKDFKK